MCIRDRHWITGAGVSRLHLIFARVFDERGQALGIGGFLAVRDEAKEGNKGLRVARREQTMGLRGMPEGELVFENLEVLASMAVLPPSGLRRGFADLMNAYNSPVSYTHLTLPTILRVYICVVAAALTKK